MTTESKKARRIPASRELQSRVGTGVIDEKNVQKAQNVIEENEVDFAPLAKQELDKMQAVIKSVQEGSMDPTKALHEVTMPIMNLKANAATFNYPVISSLAGTVLSLLEEFKSLNKDLIAVADNLHKAIMVAIAMNMRGAPDERGQMLVKEFKDVCKTYLLRAKS